MIIRALAVERASIRPSASLRCASRNERVLPSCTTPPSPYRTPGEAAARNDNPIVATVLLALGMSMISLPFKLLLFVMLDGWTRLVHGLVLSYR